MATKITVSNRPDQSYVAAVTSAAAADPTGDIEITVTAGIKQKDIIAALDKAKAHVSDSVVLAADAP